MTQPNPSTEAPAAAGCEVVITRILDAPRALVFAAWTDPAQVAQWWSPYGFTNPVCEVDARPGGAFLVHMRGPDGVVYPDKGVFQEVVAPERLVFTSSAMEDETGNPQLEAITTVTFEEHDGKTKLTVQSVVVKATPAVAGALAGMEVGWSQSLAKLAEYLATGSVTPREPSWEMA
jgi:uncharacterized protein YndB with AHSA1/START domain